MLGKLFGPVMKVAALLVKNTLLPSGLTAAASAADAGIQKNMHGLSNIKQSYEWFLKNVRSLEDSGILIDGISETVNTKIKEPKVGLLGMFSETLRASMSGKTLVWKGVAKAGRRVARVETESKKLLTENFQFLLNFQSFKWYWDYQVFQFRIRV